MRSEEWPGRSLLQSARLYLEVHGTYNLLSNCSYNTILSRVTVVMGLVFGLQLQLRSRL